MAEQGSWGALDEPERMSPREAAELIGVTDRTVARWIDSGKLSGGRPSDPATGQAVSGSHRWVDAAHAVAVAVGARRGHLVPARWRHLLPRRAARTEPAAGDPAESGPPHRSSAAVNLDAALREIDQVVGNQSTLDESDTRRVRGILLSALSRAEAAPEGTQGS